MFFLSTTLCFGQDTLANENMIGIEKTHYDFKLPEAVPSVIQVNANSPFLPGHGDIVMWGGSSPTEKEDIIALLNGICGIDSFIFLNEQTGSEIVVYYITDGLSKELYRDLICSILDFRYKY